MDKATSELIEYWRDELGPAAWAECGAGWVGPDGQIITLEPWQRAVLDAWWLHRDEVSTLAISNIKKSGKTFVDAVLLAWRWLCLPGVHFAAGNDLEQAQSRCFGEVVEMCERHGYLKKNVRITENEIEFLPTGSRLIALASDAAGNAGSNHLSSSHTEAWALIYPAGIRGYEELTPPPGRTFGLPALRIVDSYAGIESESTLWHGVVDKGLSGSLVSDEWPIYLDSASGLMLFHDEGPEAQERCFRGTPEERERYYSEQRAMLRPGTFQRLHCNQRVAGESSFVDAAEWQACFDASLIRWHAGERQHRRMVLGIDASTSSDTSAIIGCWFNPETLKTEIVYTKLYRPSVLQSAFGLIRNGRATIDLQSLEDEVLRIHAAGGLDCVVADVYQLHHASVEWQRQGIRVHEMAQGSPRIEADEGLWRAIKSRSIAHDGDADLAEHISHAATQESMRGQRLVKASPARKIDMVVATSMANWGALEYQRRAGEVFIYSENPWTEEGDERFPDGWQWAQVGGRMFKIPKDKTSGHALTRGAMLACRRRMGGCGDCIRYFESIGEFEKQEIEAQAKLQDSGHSEYRREVDPRIALLPDLHHGSDAWEQFKKTVDGR